MITSWNGLAVLALAEAGAALGPPGLGRAPRREAAELLLRRGTWSTGGCAARRGTARSAPRPAVLEDHGCLADGLLALHQATGAARWLTAATELLDLALDHFAGPDGSFFDTADDAEALLHRPRELTDNASPVRRLGAGLGAAHGVGAGRRAGPVPGRGRGGAARGRAPWPSSTRGSPGTG